MVVAHLRGLKKPDERKAFIQQLMWAQAGIRETGKASRLCLTNDETACDEVADKANRLNYPGDGCAARIAKAKADFQERFAKCVKAKQEAKEPSAKPEPKKPD